MKNQYVGDATDFFKYALLREFQRTLPQDRLVMGWMLTEDDEGPDGKKLAYLKQSHKYRDVDPELFDGLQKLIADEDRTIDGVMTSSLLGRALSQSHLLDDHAEARASYFSELSELAPAHSLVFLDPDNGLEVKSTRKGRKNSSKFAYWDEVEDLADSRSVLIFQHWRRVNHETMAGDLRAELRARTPNHDVFDIRSPNVLFLAATLAADTKPLFEAAQRVAARWPAVIAVDPPWPTGQPHVADPRPELPLKETFLASPEPGQA